jgi:multidrug efflux pump subunit AcrA (membrane-fusion protein)
MLITWQCVFADDDDDKVKTANVDPNKITLNATQIKAIGLEVVKVQSQVIAKQIQLHGTVGLLVNAQQDVNARVTGDVIAVMVELGAVVKVGEPLAKIRSRLVGDPPPTILISAPMNGVIDARNINPGQSVEPATKLFHISDRAKMLISANVYEEDLHLIKIDQIAQVSLLSDPALKLIGKVITVDPNIDPSARTSQILIMVDNSDNILKPNMSAQVTLNVTEKKVAMAIPNNAILTKADESFVFIRKNNEYQRRIIKIGMADLDYTEVLSGLTLNDEVVTQGNHELFTYWVTGGNLKAEE